MSSEAVSCGTVIVNIFWVEGPLYGCSVYSEQGTSLSPVSAKMGVLAIFLGTL